MKRISVRTLVTATAALAAVLVASGAPVYLGM